MTPQESILQSMQFIRKKLGGDVNHEYFKSIRYYSNYEGDYWNVEFEDKSKITYYRHDGITIEQNTIHYKSLEDYVILLGKVCEEIKEIQFTKKQLKDREIKNLKSRLEDLENEKDE